MSAAIDNKCPRAHIIALHTSGIHHQIQIFDLYPMVLFINFLNNLTGD